MTRAIDMHPNSIVAATSVNMCISTKNCPMCNQSFPNGFFNSHRSVCKSGRISSINNDNGQFGRDANEGVEESDLIRFSDDERKSEEEHSTSMSDEPNFIIYSLIKELDCLIECNKLMSSSASDSR